jgi:4-hydroxybenzoate polyprenyltransferase
VHRLNYLYVLREIVFKASVAKSRSTSLVDERKRLMALNLTQLVGATAFLVAALACLRTGLRCGHGLWYAIAALLLALALEVVCGVRYRAHDLANSLLALEETYGARQSIQHLLLITVLVVTAAVLLMVLKLRSIAVAARLVPCHSDYDSFDVCG